MEQDTSVAKKIVLAVFVLGALVSFVYLVYALLYSTPNTILRKNALIAGLSFVCLTSFAFNFYNRTMRGR